MRRSLLCGVYYMNNGLLMDDAELTVSFRRARDQHEQINVLADLCCTSPMEIAKRLELLGELKGTGLSPRMFSSTYYPVQPAGEPPPRRRGRPLSFDATQAHALFAAGKSDIEIALALATSSQAVRKWRYSVGLMRPKGGVMVKKTQHMEVEQAAATAAPEIMAVPEAELPPAREELPLARLADILVALEKDGAPDKRVLIGGEPVRGLTVRARYDGSTADGPAEIVVELER